MNVRHIQITLLFLLASTFSHAQRYVSRDGHVSFFSEAPLENIEAHNHQVTSILDLEKNEVVASILMKFFKFDKSLMEEHFNENYLESEKFPKATFQGAFKSERPVDVTKNSSYPVEADGKLTLHGVTRPIKITGTMEVKDNTISIKAKFKITIEEYNIEIPTLVIKNIAEVVDVTIDFKYVPQKI
jgi:YceI-like domain